MAGFGVFSELLLLQVTSCRAEQICSARPEALRKEHIECCVWVASLRSVAAVLCSSLAKYATCGVQPQGSCEAQTGLTSCRP